MSRILDHRGNRVLSKSEKRLEEIGRQVNKRHMPGVISQIIDHNYIQLRLHPIKVVKR